MEKTSKRLVVLGAGESGTGAAILAKDKGMDVFLSDFGKISPKYRAVLRNRRASSSKKADTLKSASSAPTKS